MNHPIAIWNDWAGTWSEAFWRASLQGGLAILLVGLICLAVPRLPARIKCWLWRIAYLKVLVALVWSAPLELPLLQAPKIVQNETLGFVPPMPIPAANLPLETERVEVIADAPIALPDEPIEALPIVALVPVPVEMPSQADTPTLSLAGGCLMIWSIALAIGLVRLTRSYWSTHRLLRESRPADDEHLLALWNDWTQRMGSSGKVPRLRIVTGSGSPLLVGVWRPVVLLPEQLLSRFNEQQIGMMLGHELAHARRRDLLWNWLPAIVTTGLFFHPLVWLARRGWYAAQEAACDEMVITRAGVSPRDYGHVLITLVEQLSGHSYHRPLGALGVIGQKHSLARRLKTMQSIRQFSRRKLVLIAATITTLAIIGTVPWTLVAQPPQRKLSKAERKAAMQTVESAKKAYETILALDEFGQAPPNSNAIWSRHWLEAEKIVANTRDEEIAAHLRHLQRMEARVQVVTAHNQHGTDKGSALDFSAAKFYRNQARYLLLRAGGTETFAIPRQNQTDKPSDADSPNAKSSTDESSSDSGTQQHQANAAQLVAMASRARREVELKVQKERDIALQKKVSKASSEYVQMMTEWALGQTNHVRILKTSARWLDAELAVAKTVDRRLEAFESHALRMKDFRDRVDKLHEAGHALGNARMLAVAERYSDDARQVMINLGGALPQNEQVALNQALRGAFEQRYASALKDWAARRTDVNTVLSAINYLVEAEGRVHQTESNSLAPLQREFALTGQLWLATVKRDSANHSERTLKEQKLAREAFDRATNSLKHAGKNVLVHEEEEKEQGNKPHDGVSNAKSDLKATQTLAEFGQVLEERLVESARNRVAAREESDRRDARRNDLQKAKAAYAKIMSDWANGQTNHNAIVKTSDHWLSAELAAAQTFDKRIEAYEAHVDRAQYLLAQIEKLRKAGHAAGSKKILAEMVRYKDEASRRMVRLGDTAPLVTLASKDEGANASEEKSITLDQALRADAERKYLATMKGWKSNRATRYDVYSAISKLISAERGIYPTEANQFAMARREYALRGDFWLATKAKHTSEFDRERLGAKEWYQEAKLELKRLGATVAVTDGNK